MVLQFDGLSMVLVDVFMINEVEAWSCRTKAETCRSFFRWGCENIIMHSIMRNPTGIASIDVMESVLHREIRCDLRLTVFWSLRRVCIKSKSNPIRIKDSMRLDLTSKDLKTLMKYLKLASEDVIGVLSSLIILTRVACCKMSGILERPVKNVLSMQRETSFNVWSGPNVFPKKHSKLCRRISRVSNFGK
ncbi:hypothetical protein WICPIJ_004862 [Wickerhamomyces pijperi]|uniref:Uncharacterized protein n=1 Tax=Wickerhamomyces pijperi TaxID=599730 RepID=A0A9P8TLN3_WICPI|nr:hypothetical protein WICPIJ_004862 [Wickerhamomyces pijperi]